MARKPPRRRGALSEEDRRIWNAVAATTEAMHKTQPSRLVPPEQPKGPEAPASEPGDEPRATRLARTVALPQSLRPEPAKPRAPRVTMDLRSDVGPVGRPEAGLDRRTAERLRRGVRTPDARIDLHGMTAERAHRVCLTFLGDAMAQGHRLVLVITGKGGRRDEDDAWGRGRGVLKDQLPGWLRASHLRHHIVGIYEASARHGGGGAYYVYLKRRR